MGHAALAAVQAVGYRNAGTVEFLVDPSGRFWFLEVNTRLQVEHPVTEAVTGMDLVREQLRVAQGLPLSVSQADLSIAGHAVEARLYAEDPAAGFLPVTGTLVEWAPAPGVRWDSGVESGSVVGVHFDPLLAKVIAHAPTRQEATLGLARALEHSRIRGLTTNRDFLVAALRHPAFLAGEATTSFIETSGVATARSVSPDEWRVAGMAAALAGHAGAPTRHGLPKGWRNSVMPPERRVYGGQGPSGPLSGMSEVSYRIRRDGSFDFGGATVRLRGVDGGVDGGWVDFDLDGRRHRLHVLRRGDRVWAQGPEGDVELRAEPRFPEPSLDAGISGGLVAPMPGKVVSVAVAEGDQVGEGQVLLILEAMKMEHRVLAPHPGTVSELRAGPGDQVNGGDLLVVLS
jgi:propionyl-CoA carboxylase alpha chain